MNDVSTVVCGQVPIRIFLRTLSLKDWQISENLRRVGVWNKFVSGIEAIRSFSLLRSSDNPKLAARESHIVRMVC